jgi:hypothetical protein
MNKWKLFITSCAVIICAIFASMVAVHDISYIDDKCVLDFLAISPTIIGILLAGVLTSLAVILAIIGTSELIEIREIDLQEKKTFYEDMTKNLKQDIYLIFLSLVTTSFLWISLSSNLYFIIPIKGTIPFVAYRLLFAVEIALLALSFMATNDIINGMFEIFKFKYELSNTKPRN